MGSVPEEFKGSNAIQFVVSQGWDWKESSSPNIELDRCPYADIPGSVCAGKTGFGHFYMEIHGTGDEEIQRDGLHVCHRCSKGGSLKSLKTKMGVLIPGVEGRKDWGGAAKDAELLPDVDKLHDALLADTEAMDYLTNGRGFSLEIIQKTRLGLKEEHYFRETGKVRALVYPYLVNGNAVWAHYRTLPTMPICDNKVPKAFSSPAGWDSALYNGEILVPGLSDLTMVEGEPNCIAAMDHGIANIVGVPGANIKKAQWIEQLDKTGLEKIYICYDKDKVGQRAAQELAGRIGIDRCYRIVLPDFTVTTDEGVTRPGKDLNEWFVDGGGTLEAFEALKKGAQQFDVTGTATEHDALQEFYDEILGNGTVEPKYKSQWGSLNKLIGFDKGDLIYVLAEEKIGKTTWVMNLVDHLVEEYGIDAAIVCLEMTRAKQARKYICYKTQIADNITETPEAAEALLQQFLKAIPELQKHVANRKGDLYFCSPNYTTSEEVFTLMRDIIRRYGVDCIVLDNLQLLADTTPGAKSNRTEHLSQMSKTLARLAKELNVLIIGILQPHRVPGGQIVGAQNVDGSSQVTKDCDGLITLHRSKVETGGKDKFDNEVFSEGVGVFKDETKVTVALSRYSSGGWTTLFCDGARSTFNEKPPEQVKFIQEQAKQGVGYDAQIKELVGIENDEEVQV